jgi:hypothetical protein
MPRHRWSIVAVALAVCCARIADGEDDLFPLSPPEEVFLVSADSEMVKLPPAPAVYEADDGHEPADSSLDSRLDQFQSELETLSSKLTITSRDEDWKITVFGALTGEMIYAQQRAVIPSAIVFLSPFTGRDTPSFEIHGKQSTFGFLLQGPEIFGMQSGGLVLTAFYGENLLADEQGLFIPRAFAELKDDNYRFAVGALGDIINPRIPDTLDFVKGQGGGNLGYFRGQFRADCYLHIDDETQITLQAGLGNPITTSFVRDIRTLVEDNGWPNVEGRMMLGLGPVTKRGILEFRTVELGLSGLGGQIRRAGAERATFNIWAVGADARCQLTERCGLKGEVFHGQAIGNYNAAIVQIFNPFTLEAIRTTGGWAELFVDWNDSLHTHIGAGVDDPLNRTLSPGLPTLNSFSFANLIWDATKNLEIGFEIGRHRTDYTPGATFDGLPIGNNEAWIYRTRVSLRF